MSSLTRAYGLPFCPHLLPLNSSFTSAVRSESIFATHCSSPTFSLYIWPGHSYPPRPNLSLKCFHWVPLAGLVISSQMLPKHFVHWTLFIAFIRILYLVLNLFFYHTKLWISQHLSFFICKIRRIIPSPCVWILKKDIKDRKHESYYLADNWSFTKVSFLLSP